MKNSIPYTMRYHKTSDGKIYKNIDMAVSHQIAIDRRNKETGIIKHSNDLVEWFYEK